MRSLRELARLGRSTPVHPQWLLGRRRIPAGLESVKGAILDIGAADRWIAPHLAPEASYVALDYPATGNEFYAARPDIFGDARALPLADATVDAVVCLEVIEHVPDPGRAVQEIARVLRPGGVAWISMPFLYPVHNEPFDFQRYTKYGLGRDAERAGLEVVELRRDGHALRTAGLITCLSIAGGMHKCRLPLKALLLLPALLMILLVNLVCGLLAQCWPDWPNVATGHHAKLRKPTADGRQPTPAA